MKREKIKLTEEDFEWFDMTASGVNSEWEINGEIYKWVDEIRTDKFSDGPSWDTIVQRESDGKYFMWHVWDAGYHNGYIMSQGDEYQIQEVFQKVIKTTIYE